MPVTSYEEKEKLRFHSVRGVVMSFTLPFFTERQCQRIIWVKMVPNPAHTTCRCLNQESR